MTTLNVLAGVVVLIVLVAAASLRLVQQYERGVVFRFGRVLPGVRAPGLRLIVPIADRMRKVSVQVIVLSVPGQGAITRDNVTVQVDAAVYFRVVDPVKAIVNVRDYQHAVEQVAQTSLRTVIGRADLDTLLSDRERISAELKAVIDEPTEQPWGVRIELVELKDIALPETMKRSMSRQAEAERERRARVIAADGEYQASAKLAEAAAAMAATPGAFQLRLLQTVSDVAAEKNSTLVMPFPVELLRFFDQITGHDAAGSVRVPDSPAGLQGDTVIRSWALRYSPVLRPLLTVLGMGPGLSFLRLDGDVLTLRMGWAFRTRIPVDRIRDAADARPPLIGGWGVHGWRGRWLVNGSAAGVVRLRIDPPVPARAVGLPVLLRTLWVSLEDPEGFLTELGSAHTWHTLVTSALGRLDRVSTADLAMLAMDTTGVPEHIGAVLVLDPGPGFDPDAAARTAAARLGGPLSTHRAVRARRTAR